MSAVQPVSSDATDGAPRPLSFWKSLTLRQFLTKRHVFVALVVGIALSGVLAAEAFSSAPAGVPPTPETRAPSALAVATVTPSPTDGYVRRRWFTGETVARRTSALGFERGGRIDTLLVEEGARVAKDAPLARLDRRRLDAERLRLIAARAEAAAELSLLVEGPRDEQIDAAAATVADLTERVALLVRKQDRRRALLKDAHISSEEFDEIASALVVGRAQLLAAKERHEELLEGTRPQTLEAQRARVAQFDAQIALLDVDIEDTTLEAPFAGRILRRHIDDAVVIAHGAPVYTLVEDGAMEVRVGITPDAADALPLGSSHTIDVGGKTLAARVQGRLPMTDAATRTQTFVLRIEAAADALPEPGRIARVAVTQRETVEGQWLPASVLARGVRGLWSVLAVEKGVVVRHHVELLHAEDDRVLVRGTLSEDSRVIVGDLDRVVPGQAVRLATAP